MKKILLLFFGMGIFGFMNAQQARPSVIATGGTSTEAKFITLDWTLGELAVRSLHTSNGLLTQGFHQPILSITELPVEPTPEIEAHLYPNPVSSMVYLKIDADSENPILIELNDAWGRRLRQIEGTLADKSRELDLSKYPSGTYFLSIRKKDGASLKTFKVVKTH